MAQTSRVTGVATHITSGNNITQVWYHKTAVVTFTANTIELNSGGWRTNTTKLRMNQTAAQFNLPFSVYQKKGEWFVTFKGETVPFHDGMCLFNY
jgi:hypothetical protein